MPGLVYNTGGALGIVSNCWIQSTVDAVYEHDVYTYDKNFKQIESH